MRNLGFIKPKESDFGAVAVPFKGTDKTKFFLVHPIRNTINNGSFIAIRAHLLGGTVGQIHHIEIIVQHIGHFAPVRRKCGLLDFGLGDFYQILGSNTINIIDA